MNINGLIYQFKNEEALRFQQKIGKREEKAYDVKDVEQFKEDLHNGKTIKQAAIDNKMPIGTAYRYVPDELKANRDKEQARDLIIKRLKGEISISFPKIGLLCGYSRSAARVMANKIKKELCL
tara:strand:- start:3983 stop:4351 length:369 start_codon:yes stop_codon:yes gene_type:complete